MYGDYVMIAWCRRSVITHVDVVAQWATHNLLTQLHE